MPGWGGAARVGLTNADGGGGPVSPDPPGEVNWDPPAEADDEEAVAAARKLANSDGCAENGRNMDGAPPKAKGWHGCSRGDRSALIDDDDGAPWNTCPN